MRSILVAIDGSESALRALEFAVKQARLAPKAKLHVLTVRPPANTYAAWEIYVTADRIEEVATARARDILDAATRRLADSGCEFETEQLEGEAAETITRRAAELGCESITMGSHGHGTFGILFMGSVAQRVVHHATVPVTVVK
jgi:nucleotide-binding universal stress UspA family protein